MLVAFGPQHVDYDDGWYSHNICLIVDPCAICTPKRLYNQIIRTICRRVRAFPMHFQSGTFILRLLGFVWNVRPTLIHPTLRQSVRRSTHIICKMLCCLLHQQSTELPHKINAPSSAKITAVPSCPRIRHSCDAKGEEDKKKQWATETETM